MHMQTRKRSNNRPQQMRGARWYIKRPISLEWIRQAGRLPGKAAVLVALAIWFRLGVEGSSSAVVSTRWSSHMGLSRKNSHRGLRLLEITGLVSVKRRRGKPPIVTILDIESASNQRKASA